MGSVSRDFFFGDAEDFGRSLHLLSVYIPIYEIQFVIFISYGQSKCLNIRLGQCSVIVCYDMMFKY